MNLVPFRSISYSFERLFDVEYLEILGNTWCVLHPVKAGWMVCERMELW